MIVILHEAYGAGKSPSHPNSRVVVLTSRQVPFILLSYCEYPNLDDLEPIKESLSTKFLLDVQEFYRFRS